ncbi:hypothetical protein N136_03339 [Leifsonia aquatica ATCC 14665]|uniref:Uncharacterized protein n=1 Tax=Leifsonia aquatica ATCC 14665 TaxID=1358026 RepID=U2T6I5_LEIAQ|nr:hypothetical protein N136_03339 [Leifsonia aquatica ATCC 14665]
MTSNEHRHQDRGVLRAGRPDGRPAVRVLPVITHCARRRV